MFARGDPAIFFCNFLYFWLALQALGCLYKQVFWSNIQFPNCASLFWCMFFTESSQLCTMSLSLGAPTHFGVEQECAFIWFRGIVVATLTHIRELSVRSDCFRVPFGSINTFPSCANCELCTILVNFS